MAKASRASTTALVTVPLAIGDGTPETRKRAAAAGETTMPVWHAEKVPAWQGEDVPSVTWMLWVPAVFSVTANGLEPASVAVKAVGAGKTA